MAELFLCCNSLTPPPLPTFQRPHQFSPRIPIVIGGNGIELRRGTTTAFAAKSGGFSLNSVNSLLFYSSASTLRHIF